MHSRLKLGHTFILLPLLFSAFYDQVKVYAVSILILMASVRGFPTSDRPKTNVDPPCFVNTPADPNISVSINNTTLNKLAIRTYETLGLARKSRDTVSTLF